MNIINAIINLIQNPITNITDSFQGNNRANNAGIALEEYVKDLFAGTLNDTDKNLRLQKISRTFSYLGNDSNPPDAILKNGDAIEVKKITQKNAALALNSSYPKHKLYSNSSMISKACKTSEEWTEKDIIYIVGIIQKNELKYLCMVYGSDYCASSATYEHIKNTIKTGIKSIPNIELATTKELGKLHKVDPLGITYLRVRGMWGIENPFKVFDYIFERDISKQFNFMAIINTEKYETFTNKLELEKIECDNLSIKDVFIKNPDNPAQLRNAKLIRFTI